MGTNLFIDGLPSPVVISVTLPREARNFRDVAEVAQSLSEIDSTLRNTWPRIWPSYGRRRQREVLVLRFRIDSPPSFEILADPAWLTLLFVILTGYKQAKESISEVVADASRLIAGVKGLTETELEHLAIGVRLTLERLLQAGEERSLNVAEKFRRIRHRLTGDSDDRPTIEVKDVDSKHRP